MGIDCGPETEVDVGRIRLTEACFANGERVRIADHWDSCDRPHRNLGRWWTGSTHFTDNNAAAKAWKIEAPRSLHLRGGVLRYATAHTVMKH